MKLNFLFFTILLTFATTAAAQKPAPPPNKPAETVWKEFVSNEGEFKISFPKTPEEIKNMLGEGAKAQQQTAFRIVTNAGFFEVSYMKLAYTINDLAILGEVYDRSLEYFKKNPKIKVIASNDVKVGKYTGREILTQTTAGDARSKMRVFIVGSRFYTLLFSSQIPQNAQSKRAELYDAAMNKFFASFALTGNAPSTEELAAKVNKLLPDNYQGKLEKGIYTNDFLGFTIKLPDGWKPLNTDEEGAVKEVGKQLLQKDDAKYNAQIESSLESARTLLAATKNPFGTPENAQITIQLETRAVGDGYALRDVAAATQKFLQSNFNAPIKITREIYETKISGADAIGFEFEATVNGINYHQRIILVRRKGFMTMFSFGYLNAEDLAPLEKSLQSLSFTTENNVN